MSLRDNVASWRMDTDDDADKKKKLIIVAGVVLLLAIVLFLFLGLGLKAFKGGNVKASELIGTDNVNTERNDAGGIIVDINWDEVIGYDRDGNPIYGTNGLVASVGGYDMCGAPILREDMRVIDKAEDGLPIYDYSAIDQARMRGKTNGLNPDIDWDTVVAYDADGNPIFGTFGADDNIFGYDLNGNPIYKDDIEITGYSESGMPYISYSTREVIREKGRQQISDIVNGRNGSNGADAEGANGANGNDATGKEGQSGANGQNGSRGQNGIGGQNGKDGESVIGLSGGNGNNGQSGRNGKDGKDGPKGDRGPQGNSGQNGKNGVSGLDGKNGANGRNGADGQRGSNGFDGSNGNDGYNGADGSNGNNGGDGRNGSNGSRGANGADGANGSNGSNGLNGADGSNGQNGKQGERGATGATGLSTYTHIKYCDIDPSTNHAAKIYDKPSTATKFIGIYADNSKVASNEPTSYVWTRLKDLAISSYTDDATGVTTLKIR